MSDDRAKSKSSSEERVLRAEVGRLEWQLQKAMRSLAYQEQSLKKQQTHVDEAQARVDEAAALLRPAADALDNFLRQQN